jgi:broad specificity phosphatase PhoE
MMKRDAVLDTILVSPYLRTIQTAIPTANAFGLQLNLEEGIAEVLHSPDWLPTAGERFKYFPQVRHILAHYVELGFEYLRKATMMGRCLLPANVT